MNGRSPLLVAACALLPSLCGAQVDSASIRQVLGTEDRRFRAMVHADTSALGQLLATDLTYTHTEACLGSDRRIPQGAGTHNLPETPPSCSGHHEVRVFGSSAIVTGQSAMRVES